MEDEQTHFKIIPGEIELWLEQETVHLKAITKEGDPVELTSDNAQELIQALEQLVKMSERFG